MIIKAYHISRKKNRESILQYGLLPKNKPSGRISYKPRIFFSTNIKDLGFDFVDYENVDCWEFEVDSAKIKPDEFSGSTNHCFIEFIVKPNKLNLLESY